jgi:hypothetical protein
MKLVTSILQLIFVVSQLLSPVNSDCCYVNLSGLCDDGNRAKNLCCAKGKEGCNVFCCNCDGGCRTKRSGRPRYGQSGVDEMAAFQTMDTNGDGGVDQEEAFAYLGHLYSGNNFSFYNYDTNRDGYLSLTEIKHGVDY